MLTVLMAAMPGSDPIPILAFTDKAIAERALAEIRSRLAKHSTIATTTDPIVKYATAAGFARFYLRYDVVHADSAEDGAAIVYAFGRAVAVGEDGI